MFQWHRPLASTALMVVTLSVMLAISGQSLAGPIKVNFTAMGDPADPTNAGITATGNFTFDTSIIPYGGGQIWANYPPGLAIGTVSFEWDGHSWTAADAYAAILTFGSDGSLIGWSLEAKISPGRVEGGTTDFAFDIHPSGSSTFSYSRPDAPGAYSGTVVSWSAASVPIIAAFTESTTGHLYALSSTGDLYVVPTADIGCSPLGGGQHVGNMFYGPPPSPVVNAGTYGGGFWVCLQNGDVYSWCPSSGTSILAGNIFAASGVTAVAPNVPRFQNQVALARPNPFNPSVQIPYTVATAGQVSLRIFDASGRLVRTLEDVSRARGEYTARWDGNSDAGAPSASGTYFFKVQFGDGSQSEQKVTLVR